MPEAGGPPRRGAVPEGAGRVVARGLLWGGASQLALSVLQFAAMLVLVRILAPADYGKANVVLGVLTVLNAANCGVFMQHALQLEGGVEPPWSLHWRVGLRIQAAMFALCNVVAGALWAMPSYAGVAPLLHLASVGLLLEVPSRLRSTMLYRRMAYGRLRAVQAVAAVASLGATLGLAAAGGGAFALVLGANVVPALVFAVDLLGAARWRPERAAPPGGDRRAYAQAVRFGLQQAGSNVLRSSRSLAVAAALPPVLGYGAIGILNRAEAVCTITVSRLVQLLSEVVYPLLPQARGEPSRFARYALLYGSAVCLVLVPGAAFLGLRGAEVARLLYGDRWAAAEPWVLPGTLVAAFAALGGVGYSLLLAKNRLRRCLLVDALWVPCLAAVLVLTILRPGSGTWIWGVAAAQAGIAVIALAWGGREEAKGYGLRIVGPPLAASALAAGLAFAAGPAWAASPLGARVALDALVFGAAYALAMRLLFPTPVRAILERFPGGARLLRIARLSPTGGAAP